MVLPQAADLIRYLGREIAETTARQDAAGGPRTRRRTAALATANPCLDPEHPDMTEAAAYPDTIKMIAAILRDPGTHPPGRNNWQKSGQAVGGPTSMAHHHGLSCQ